MRFVEALCRAFLFTGIGWAIAEFGIKHRSLAEFDYKGLLFLWGFVTVLMIVMGILFATTRKK